MGECMPPMEVRRKESDLLFPATATKEIVVEKPVDCLSLLLLLSFLRLCEFLEDAISKSKMHMLKSFSTFTARIHLERFC